MCPSPASASAAGGRALRSGAKFKPTSMATLSRSSKPKKALPTGPPFSLALARAFGPRSTLPAPPPFASPPVSIPNLPPSPLLTPATPPTVASIPQQEKFLAYTEGWVACTGMRELFIQLDESPEGEIHAAASPWKERSSGFGTRPRVHGHVLCLRTG